LALQYDLIKKMESAGKSVVMGVTGGEGPTVVQPSQYRDRFQVTVTLTLSQYRDRFQVRDSPRHCAMAH
jgi:hypothetical protein